MFLWSNIEHVGLILDLQQKIIFKENIMSNMFNLSKVMMGIASLTLSAGVCAGSVLKPVMDPIEDVVNWFGATTQAVVSPVAGWGMDDGNKPDYMVHDKDTHHVEFLDGVDKGHMVFDDGTMMYKHKCRKGDKITNLHTNRSGIIKGVKDHGTMDVMMPNGKTVRYQYVNYKIKPL